MTSRAVTFGRYTLLTRAHLATLETILQRWPAVTVGILEHLESPVHAELHLSHAEKWATHEEFYQMCTKNWAPARNPFSAEERASIWQAAIRASSLADRVRTRVIPRPELHHAAFNCAFPADEYDLVFPAPTPACGDFDQARNATFGELLARPVHEVRPPFVTHTTDILREVAKGRSWEEFLAPGIHRLFLAMNGPERLARRMSTF
ncbi:hypothetical protein ACIBQ6_34845 [Nonomuraea sp. NPDC049655]|uniref:hypothetical protein n=1 Tax=Nonomuraea sp. NPDC049655 TaxID=3364355 RepID=UPI003793C10D